MWNNTEFENHIKARLLAELKNVGETMFASYVVTRSKLVNDIYEEIKGADPDLSDHGPDHVANVLDNAGTLLSLAKKTHRFHAIELYCLGMAILFHDVGNLYGRSDHRSRIGDIFDWARGSDQNLLREKMIIRRVVRAHTGTAADGSYDTLKEVGEIDQLCGKPVRLRDIAAILRFADELAEGPRRTSEYRRRNKMISVPSQVYHDYASITNILASRGTGRILLTYDISVTDFAHTGGSRSGTTLAELLGFVYERIIKLDQERRYARHYSDVLGPFKATEAVFNFHSRTEVLELDLPPILLNDKVVPGEPARTIEEIDEHYNINPLVAQIAQLASEGEE